MNKPTQRRLAAIVAADVVGFSRLMGVDEVGTLAALRAHRAELIDAKIAEHGGRIVKTMGDGLLLEFPSVVDAVTCSIETQDQMALRNSDVPEDKRITFRIGINLGDIIIEGEDILGDGVNIAARLEALAEPGGVAVSGRVHDDVRDRLAINFEDAGEQSLKNIARPIRVWRWPATTDASSTPATPLEPTASAEQSAIAVPDKPSLAILPFANKSNDPDQEFLADGITEDITTALSKFRSFLVISRNSTFSYKDKVVNTVEVGRELGVRYIVEGSVRKAGNRVRVTAQLVQAETGNQVWADRFDREIEDIFDLQDELSEAIVVTVEQEIGSIERTRAAHERPENLRAWELFQRGMFFVWQMNEKSLATGVDLLRDALDKDPNFSEAHARLAFAYLHQIFLGFADDLEATLSNAKLHTEQAVRLDDRSSVGFEMQARILIFEKKFDEAVAAAQHALRLNPGSSTALSTLAYMLFFSDRLEEALEPLDQAMRLSPKDHSRHNQLHSKGSILCETGEVEEGLRLLRQAMSLPHGDYRCALILARYAGEAGLIEEARHAAKRVLELNPGFSFTQFKNVFSAYLHPNYVARFEPFIRDLGFPEE